MTDVFEAVLTMSLTGSYVIAVVVMLRWILLGKLPKCYSFALWAVVLFRLLSPISFDSTASIVPQSVIPVSTVMLNGVEAAMPNINHTDVVISTAAIGEITAPDAMTVLSWIWAGGIVLLLCYSAVSCLRLHSRVAGAVHMESNIYQSTAINSPFVLGLIKPKIYLPPNIPPDEYDYILRHEQIHIRRLDYITKPLAFLTLCLHWFNPLCWLAFVLFGRDMEMSCDERVIRELGDDIRLDYSDSLLAMASKGGFTGGGPLAFGESGVGQRIKNVLNFRRPAFWLTIVALLAVLIAVGGLATNPVEQQDISFAEMQPELSARQHLNLMIGAGMIYHPWERAEILPPDTLVSFYSALSTVDDRVPFQPTGEPVRNADGERLMPREIVEAVVQTYFGVDVEIVRNSEHYYAKEKAYALPGLGGATDAIVLNERTEGESTLIDFEVLQDGEPFGRGVLTIVKSGVGYRYRSMTLEETGTLAPAVPAEGMDDDPVLLTGLSQEETAELMAQKDKFEAMTPREQALALEGGTVGCLAFEHMWWEESISTELIRFTEQKADRSFVDWVNASQEREQCTSIYDLARDFYIPYYEMEEAIKAAGQEELYPLERLKARFSYFGLPVTKEEVSYIAQIGILSSAGMNAYSWSSPAEIEPDDFMYYYQLTEKWPPGTVSELPDKLADSACTMLDSNGVETIYIGENTMYRAISEHFKITENQINDAENYNSNMGAYVFTDWGFGAPLDSGITAIEKDVENVVTVSYERYSRAGDGRVLSTGRLRMRERADGKYEYLSSEVREVG